MRTTWRNLLPVSILLWLAMGWIEASSSTEGYVWPTAFGVISFGLMSGLLAVFVRAVYAESDGWGGRLLVNLWWATFTAIALGVAVYAAFFGFWQTRNVIFLLITLLVIFYAIFAPSIAGISGVPVHTAIVRSNAFARYLWVVIPILVALASANLALEHFTSAIPLLAHLVRAALWGFATVAVVSLVYSRLGVAAGSTLRPANRYAGAVVSVSRSILMGYASALVHLLILWRLPERVVTWNPLLRQWSDPWTVDIGGTTTSLILAVLVTALIVLLGRQPLWAKLLGVVSYRLTWVLGFGGLHWLIGFPISVFLGLAFYLSVALVIYVGFVYARSMSRA